MAGSLFCFSSTQRCSACCMTRSVHQQHMCTTALLVFAILHVHVACQAAVIQTAVRGNRCIAFSVKQYVDQQLAKLTRNSTIDRVSSYCKFVSKLWVYSAQPPDMRIPRGGGRAALGSGKMTRGWGATIVYAPASSHVLACQRRFRNVCHQRKQHHKVHRKFMHEHGPQQPTLYCLCKQRLWGSSFVR
jgi:hypothetical protein